MHAWRRWALPALYLGVLLVIVLVRDAESMWLALYLPTLPWSVLSYGASSNLLGETVIIAGGLINSLILFYVGYLLDRRVAHDPGAV